MKWWALVVLFLAPAIASADPRFPFPKSPDQVWQNDLDLHDAIEAVADSTILQLKFCSSDVSSSTIVATFVDTNLSCQITPTVATSSMVVVATGVLVGEAATVSGLAGLFRDSTALTNSTSGACQTRDAGGASHATCAMMDVDMPLTTSQVTYKVRFRSSTAGSQVAWGNALTTAMLILEVGSR